MRQRNVTLENCTILVTGVAGFIGYSLVMYLFKNTSRIHIVGIDNINDYYDTSLKDNRLAEINKAATLNTNTKWTFIKGDITDKSMIENIFEIHHPSVIVHLAAQAGVRYSIDNPDAYIMSNIVGFYNILDVCKKYSIKHLVYASSSSVYGLNEETPFGVQDKTETPVSLYAASKKTNELIAHAYSSLYKIPTTGLRLFTVYGPAGRPDMACFKFVNDLLEEKIIRIHNYGNCKRDFTYIDDVIECMMKVILCAPTIEYSKNGLQHPPYKIYNIGSNNPKRLLEFVDILQQELVQSEILPSNYDFNKYKVLVPMQPGDVMETYADMTTFQEDFGVISFTPLNEGIRAFIEWYKKFYIKVK